MLSHLPSSRSFITSLYEIAGDHTKRMTPFGEVAQDAQLTDQEAHAAYAELKGQGLISSNRSGCVALTDAGRTLARSPRSKSKVKA